MEVRTAREDEFEAVLALAVAFYEEDGFATAQPELRRNLHVLLASPAARVGVVESGNVLVGVAITTTSFGLENGAIAELEDLYVAPQSRRQGIADLLITDSIRWARGQGCRLLEVVVAPNGQNVSHLYRYYQGRQFRDEGRQLMSRSLGPEE